MSPPTAREALEAYHDMRPPRDDAERRTAALLLGEDPDRVVPVPRSTYCELATRLLDNPLGDLALAPSELAFLERVERGEESLSAPTLARVLRMAGWVQRGPRTDAVLVPAQWGAPVPGSRQRLPHVPTR